MTLFEYLTVAISIVLGFSLTHLLANARNVFASGRRDWINSTFYLLLLISHPQMWWAFWDLQFYDKWNFLSFIFILLGPALLYMASTSLVPAGKASDIAWGNHFSEARYWVYGLFVAYALWGVLIVYWLFETPLLHPYRLLQIALLVPAIVGLLTRSRRVDGAIVLFMITAFVIGTLLFRILPGGYLLD